MTDSKPPEMSIAMIIGLCLVIFVVIMICMGMD
jgi:hypothetical protein